MAISTAKLNKDREKCGCCDIAMPYREGEEHADNLVRKEEVRKQVRSKIMLLSASLKADNRHEFWTV